MEKMDLDQKTVINLISPEKSKIRDRMKVDDDFKPTFFISFSIGADKPTLLWNEDLEDKVIKAGDSHEEMHRKLSLHPHRKIELLLP